MSFDFLFLFLFLCFLVSLFLCFFDICTLYSPNERSPFLLCCSTTVLVEDWALLLRRIWKDINLKKQRVTSSCFKTSNVTELKKNHRLQAGQRPTDLSVITLRVTDLTFHAFLMQDIDLKRLFENMHL